MEKVDTSTQKVTTSTQKAVRFVDISAWQQFQEGLSFLLGIPVSLYDSSGNLLSAPQKKDILSELFTKSREDRATPDVYSRVVLKALASGDLYVYKRSANRYIFVLPVNFSGEASLAIVGGEVYILSEDERKDFREGIAQLGFCEADMDKFKRGFARSISSEDIFSAANTVKSMAVPFLKGLYSMGMRERTGEKEGEKRSRALGIIEKIQNSMVSAPNRETLYNAILAESTELIGAEQGSVMELDDSTTSLVVKAAKGAKKKMLENLSINVRDSLVGSIVEKGSPIFVTDIEKEMPSRKNRPGYKTRSFISIPLKMESRVIGVLNISDKLSGEVFSGEDLKILSFFANYASIVIERENYHTLSQELKVLSVTDPLTGILNRRYFQEKLLEESERAKRYDEYFTLFMVDIDDFKVFNDRYGHVAGDAMLRAVANAIKGAIRSIDSVSRYGGEEFAVILPFTGKKDAFVIAERVRKNVEAARVPEDFSIKEGVTISIGVAEFAQDAKDIEELITNADRTMFFAKTMGKNKVFIYER